MYSGTNKLSVFSIILGAINLFCILPLMIYLNNLNTVPWAYAFAACIAMVTGAVALLLNACAMRGAAQDMSMNDETYMTKINDLKKRVEELENKVKL